jgi:hypothetical protein
VSPICQSWPFVSRHPHHVGSKITLTCRSQLWLSLGYDINGFKEGSIEAFWSELQMLVGEVML